MSWIPVVKLGLWNAWIMMLPILLHPLILLIVDKAVGSGDIFKKMGEAPTDIREKRINSISMIVQILMGVYSVFLPLKIGTAWFYTGLTIYLIGLVMFLTAIVNVARTPKDKLFTVGMYRFSRHPLYVAISATFMGVAIASASWVFLVLAVVNIALVFIQVTLEEQGCLARFGEDYREYMQRTPRWLGIPKSR